jgi:hypothetical protein
LQVAAMYYGPLAQALRVVPLDAPQWRVVIGLSLMPAAAGWLFRLLRAPSVQRG